MRALVVALAVLLFAKAAPAQKPKFVIFDIAVRERLAEEWDEDNRYQRERAYCLWVRVEPGVVFDVHRVYTIQRATEYGASPGGISPVCPVGTSAILHVHPPSVCHDREGNRCELGGDYAFQCQPSPNDKDFLRRSRREFDSIQCGEKQFVILWREDT